MKVVNCYLDPVSPYAALGLQALPLALQGFSVELVYRPILFAGLLKALQHKGPAEIPGKRAWTYRHVAWLARQQGWALQMPAAHPFNPLPLLRLAWACAAPAGQAGDTPSRWVMEQLFQHVWQGGGAAADEPARLAALQTRLAPVQDPVGEAVKQRLRDETDAALAAGVFGVPSFALEGRVFWGQDALPMLRAALAGDAWFADGGWDEAAAVASGVQRRG
ncbi:MAG: disulfide bond formation protein DsbA [Roseateles depolymerans]|uniref:Disulfide bond formation protein DsbA n=1 Tax=Roseateles depolymerans TaxID=76731 RepID=A0A2W5E1Q4_9BURK|nr:MAG: disulfide bond formation protein DsbA [Roseateles depolymerans]